MWGYFGGGTTKIPPHNLSTTEIPKDPCLTLLDFINNAVYYSEIIKPWRVPDA